jgi:hypothetical protein
MISKNGAATRRAIHQRPTGKKSVFVSFALFKSDSYCQGLASKTGMDAKPHTVERSERTTSLSAANEPKAERSEIKPIQNTQNESHAQPQ